MSSIVYWGSPRQAVIGAEESLPAKLDLILEKMKVRERVKDETVAIKMHTGNKIITSTVHPVFVRKVVKAVKEGGGKPFVVDVNWDTADAEERGYSSETIGCPVYPAAGPDDKYGDSVGYWDKHVEAYKETMRYAYTGDKHREMHPEMSSWGGPQSVKVKEGSGH